MSTMLPAAETLLDFPSSLRQRLSQSESCSLRASWETGISPVNSVSYSMWPWGPQIQMPTGTGQEIFRNVNHSGVRQKEVVRTLNNCSVCVCVCVHV